jgi:hypothetical protein
VKTLEHGGDFGTRQDERNPDRSLGTYDFAEGEVFPLQHLAVEEGERRERLVLG